MSQNDKKYGFKATFGKKFFFEKMNLNMFSGNVIDFRKKFNANRMSFEIFGQNISQVSLWSIFSTL